MNKLKSFNGRMMNIVHVLVQGNPTARGKTGRLGVSRGHLRNENELVIVEAMKIPYSRWRGFLQLALWWTLV